MPCKMSWHGPDIHVSSWDDPSLFWQGPKASGGVCNGYHVDEGERVVAVEELVVPVVVFCRVHASQSYLHAQVVLAVSLRK